MCQINLPNIWPFCFVLSSRESVKSPRWYAENSYKTFGFIYLPDKSIIFFKQKTTGIPNVRLTVKSFINFFGNPNLSQCSSNKFVFLIKRCKLDRSDGAIKTIQNNLYSIRSFFFLQFFPVIFVRHDRMNGKRIGACLFA